MFYLKLFVFKLYKNLVFDKDTATSIVSITTNENSSENLNNSDVTKMSINFVQNESAKLDPLSFNSAFIRPSNKINMAINNAFKRFECQTIQNETTSITMQHSINQKQIENPCFEIDSLQTEPIEIDSLNQPTFNLNVKASNQSAG